MPITHLEMQEADKENRELFSPTVYTTPDSPDSPTNIGFDEDTIDLILEWLIHEVLSTNTQPLSPVEILLLAMILERIHLDNEYLIIIHERFRITYDRNLQPIINYYEVYLNQKIYPTVSPLILLDIKINKEKKLAMIEWMYNLTSTVLSGIEFIILEKALDLFNIKGLDLNNNYETYINYYDYLQDTLNNSLWHLHESPWKEDKKYLENLSRCITKVEDIINKMENNLELELDNIELDD